MNKKVLKIGLLSLIFLSFIACKNKENELADKRIGELESYVDSLKTVSTEDLKTNWTKISDDYEIRKNTSETSL